MAIVTGDRYLELLVKFVEKQAGPLLDGGLVLKLNPVGLHYVQTRLEQLQELEGLLAGAPVDYLRAYVSDLGDHRALEQLRRILRLLPSLKVVSVLPLPARDPTPLSLLPFGRLKFLELRGCDLSTSAARGLLDLRHTLEKIICHNSTDALRHIFASRIADIKESLAWNKLSFVSCACNGLVLMDESLQLLPAVETLDLSRNQFAKVDNLRRCTKLRHLDVGFNHLRTIALLSEVSCPLVKLILRNNALTTLRGIENLKFVEGLDISYNIISSFSELELVGCLSSLRDLWMDGNPICYARWYRPHVFSFFANPKELRLDERGMSTHESWKRKILLASRQKRPAGCGFYSPAKDGSESESFYAKRRKLSRLACIEEDAQRSAFDSEVVDCDSMSCNSANLRGDEGDISDGESEIVGLMNRVELMKKERSILWLREFTEWMDKTSADLLDDDISTVSSPDKGKYTNKRGQLHLGESSRYASDLVHDSEDESSTLLLEGRFTFDTDELEHEQLKAFPSGKLYEGNEGLNPLTSNTSNFSVLNLSGIEGKGKKDAMVAIDEIIVSRLSSIHPGSPPHYQEDILHRRHSLVEEFLQLSVDSYSLASSDSDTSCDDVDSCKFCTSFHGELMLKNESSSMSEDTDQVPYKGYCDVSHGEMHMIENMKCSSDSFGAGMDVSVDIANGTKTQDSVYLDARSRRKPKKRIISLFEESSTVYDEPLSAKLNNDLDLGNDIKFRLRKDSIDCSLQGSHDDGMKQPKPNDINKQEIFGAGNLSIDSEAFFLVPHADDPVMNFFNENVADLRISETCLQCTRCTCVLIPGSACSEIEVAVLLSSERKLYTLLIDAKNDGSGKVTKVLGCHLLEEMKEIVIGMGLQLIRVHIEPDFLYLFFPRTIENARGLLCLLQLCDSNEKNCTCSLRSWEQVQVKMFEKDVCGAVKMNIFQYSLLLFRHSKNKGGSWFSRSVFVIDGYVLVCIEDSCNFNSFTDHLGASSPYFSLDFCCPIRNILEMVIEPPKSRCVTLILDHVISKVDFLAELQNKNVTDGKISEHIVWKLKWFSEDTLLKFVALVKAIYLGISTSPLPVRFASG